MRALVLAAILFGLAASADEFRAVVVTDQESAALRAAKARADEAQAAFTKLREATEERYRAKLNGAFSLDWSTDFRVIAEPRSTIYSQPKWWGGLAPMPGNCGPNCTFTLNGNTHADLKPFGDNWIER